MSDAISLLSALAGLRSGGQSARGEAASGFEALFLQGGDGSVAAEGDAGADAAALKKMYNLLAGLAKRAAYLGQDGDDPAQTLDAVAEISSDLAKTLARFDDETGLGLTQMLGAGLGERDGVDSALAAATAEAGDGSDIPVDPAAALQALQSVIATVAGALRGISTPTGTARSQAMPGLALEPQVMAATSATAAAETAATAAATGGAAADVVPSASVASDALAARQEADATQVFLPALAGRSEDDGSLASRALLSRIVAAAGEASETAAGPSTATAMTGANLTAAPVEPETRRSGPIEPLITPEDIARAMAREAQPGRDQVAAAAQAQPGQTAADQSRFAAALADQVRSAEVGEGRTRIELSPRGLGTIEVDVTTRDDGTLQVVVRADNPAVLNSLRSERDLLAQALGGLQTGSLDLQSFSDGGGQAPQGERGAVMAAAGAEDAPEAAAEPAATQTATIGAGRLDIVT